MDHRLEAQVGAALIERGWTVAAAESCTAGLLLHRLTNVPGSSAYVIGGVVAYANEIKQMHLNVDTATLEAFGAVSEPVAGQMAHTALEKFGVNIAVSITGIAGPGGGTDDKPVGLTYIGLAVSHVAGIITPDDTLMVAQHVWESDREGNKTLSVDAALRLILAATRNEL